MSKALNQGFELFAAYKISIEYPSGWDIQIKILKRDQGAVSFKSKNEECACTLTWGPLKNVQKKFSDPEEQAQNVIEGFREKSGVKDFMLLEKRKLTVNGHEAALLRVKAKLKLGSLLSRTWLSSNIQAFYLYCDETERYFIIYALSPPQEDAYLDIFSHMIQSLKCH
ncbi:MAG: hypothetical protein ACXQTI_05945 [Candidatus Nezhaarchaeales archaeon]